MNLNYFTERVTLVLLEQVEDGYGGYETTETTLGTFWAQVEAQKMRPYDHAQQETLPTQYKIWIRYLDIDPENTILLWNDKKLKILNMVNHGDVALEMLCEEVR